MWMWMVGAMLAQMGAPWAPVADGGVRMSADGAGIWKLAWSGSREFELLSARQYPARPGDVFEIRVKLRYDLHSRALPELACFDAAGKPIEARNSLDTLSSQLTTRWEEHTRTFAALPGTASVRVRIRIDGEGELWVGTPQFAPVKVDPYQTGVLISQPHPKLRKGLVLDSNLGIVNPGRLSATDRDGDGKWAIIRVDLDKLTEPEERGEDWRSRFEFHPSDIYWSDGVVLKSDTATTDRTPSTAQALHFRAKVHPGPYRMWMNDPGRAVALSLDGIKWRRFEGGEEADLGTVQAAGGVVELWVDNAYRDPISAGPVYFDYVRVVPKDNAPSAAKLLEAAARKPAQLTASTVDQRRVAVRVDAPKLDGATHWPVRCGLPIPRGELATAAEATVFDSRGRALPSQNRAMATWPDGSVKWLYLDFTHDFASPEYTVAYGRNVRATSPTKSVRIERSAEGLRVDTGAIGFLIPSARFGLLEDVRLAGGAVVQRDPIAIAIEEAAGKRWEPAAPAVVEVEQSGPLHAVICVETARPASGKPSSGFWYRARIHAYAGSPLVQVDLFLANADSRKQVQARSISLGLKPGGTPLTQVQPTAEATAPGWMTGPVSVGVEAFREQYPKALRRTAGGLAIDLWAAEGGLYDWVQGVGKTHRISLYYGPVSGDGALLAHGPVLALAQPQWYARTGALGPIGTAAESPLPEVEKVMTAHMADAVVGHLGLGFENYGDHSSSGYVKGSYLWDNNEYDLPAAAMVHFARTGDAAALRVGLASAQHYVDVDVIHYSSRRADWAGAAHTHSHGRVGHHTADGPGMSHAGYVQGLIWMSYFTGDAAGLDGARGIADWALGAIKPDSTMGTMERAMGHPLMTLTDVYEATWDAKYLAGAARLVDWATKWEHPVRSGFLAPITEQPAYISGSPFCAGLLFAGIEKFNSWARVPELDALLERLARWTLTDMWRPPHGVLSKGGSPRRGASGGNVATELRAIRAAYLRTRDPLFIAVPWECLRDGFAREEKRFGTRSTGLVFNYVPWFLSLLGEIGAPTPDSGVQVKVDGDCFEVRNTTAAPLENIAVSFQPRLDFAATALSPAPKTIAAGGTARFCYSLKTPAAINTVIEYDRVSYAHWSAMFTRQGKPRFAHAVRKIELPRE